MYNRQYTWWSKFVFSLIASSLYVVSSTAQIADGNCKFLGNVISSSVPPDYGKYWNQVTPENSGKWGSVEATRDEMKWDELDIAYQYAKSNNFPFKQHTLVWGQQQPAWLADLTAEEQMEEVEEWIKAFAERYPDTDYIDVVNEPLHAVPVYANALGGSGETGWDWVVWAFEKAREYCPNAKLVLNDYGILNNASSTAQYLQIVEILKERNLIDVIGEQGHFWETTPLATIMANLDDFHEMDLPVHISEYDVNLASDSEQKTLLESQFKALWTHPAVQGITFWGYRQGQIWRTDAYLVKSNNIERPSLAWLKTYVPTTTVDNFCSVTSAEEENEEFFSIYPNPAAGRITVEFAAPCKEMLVMDSRGNHLKTITPGAMQSSVHLDLIPGMYLLRIRSAGGTRSTKVLVL